MLNLVGHLTPRGRFTRHESKARPAATEAGDIRHESIMGAYSDPVPDSLATLSVRGVAALRALPGVEAVFRSRDGRTFYAVAREHNAIDWDRLLEVERQIREAGAPEASVSVRAHQGRDPRAMFEGLEPSALHLVERRASLRRPLAFTRATMLESRRPSKRRRS